MRLLTLLIVVCCLLSACAAGPTPTPVTSTPVKVLPPASLTAPPQPLPPPDSGQMRDLESNHLATARAYHLLALQMCNLLAFLEINDDGCKPWTNSP